MPQTSKKAESRLFGLRAETVARMLLRIKGYRIRERNYRVRGGEIDIVAIRGNVVTFVEVKARPNVTVARRAISPLKIERISIAARVWLARNDWANGWTLRGDAVFVAPFSWPRHLIAAYELSL